MTFVFSVLHKCSHLLTHVHETSANQRHSCTYTVYAEAGEACGDERPCTRLPASAAEYVRDLCCASEEQHDDATLTTHGRKCEMCAGHPSLRRQHLRDVRQTLATTQLRTPYTFAGH